MIAQMLFAKSPEFVQKENHLYESKAQKKKKKKKILNFKSKSTISV